MTVLIVEDDVELNQMLQELLIKEGYMIEKAYSGTEALLLLEKVIAIDLILMDLMLPGKTGEEVLAEVKKNVSIPIIILSAKAEINSKVLLIKNGADDYITKPFDNKELLARMEAVMRRSENKKNEEVYSFKDILLDCQNIMVKVSEQEVSLTKYEFLILKLLMSEPLRVFTKNNIFENIWNEEFQGEDNAINVHISNIRKKLAKINPDIEYIETVRGLGFRLHR